MGSSPSSGFLLKLRPSAGRSLAVLFVVLAATAGVLPARAEAQGTPPNILLIVTDDQRATDTMGVMPTTRRYFRGGGREFTNAFATTPLCCPSRAAILTGRYAHNTGVRRNTWHGLDLTTLFPRLLAQSGYRTAMAGKFLNGWKRRQLPYFDHWALLRLAFSTYVRPRFNVDGQNRRFEGYSTDVIGRHSVDFLRLFDQEDDDAPWFLYVAPIAPHYPWTPAPRHAHTRIPRWSGNPAVLERDRSDKPGYVRSENHTLAGGARVRTGQLRTLMAVDDMVGRIFRRLESLDEKRDTLAIFTSDNGFVWADHSFGGEAGTAGEKRVPYSASVKVPLLLRWPGHVEAGSVDRRLVANVDIAPTVLSAAGIVPNPAQPPLDGRPLLGPGQRARILLEYWRETRRQVPTWASLRTRRFQYVEYYRQDGRRFFREYYNLVHDRWQLRNLLADRTTSNDPNVSALQAQLRRDRRCAGGAGSALPCP